MPGHLQTYCGCVGRFYSTGWTLIPTWISNLVPIKRWMKLIIHSETSTVLPLTQIPVTMWRHLPIHWVELWSYSSISSIVFLSKNLTWQISGHKTITLHAWPIKYNHFTHLSTHASALQFVWLGLAYPLFDIKTLFLAVPFSTGIKKNWGLSERKYIPVKPLI